MQILERHEIFCTREEERHAVMFVRCQSFHEILPKNDGEERDVRWASAAIISILLQTGRGRTSSHHSRGWKRCSAEVNMLRGKREKDLHARWGMPPEKRQGQKGNDISLCHIRTTVLCEMHCGKSPCVFLPSFFFLFLPPSVHA